MARKIRKDDIVMVTAGRDKGKKGKVLSVGSDRVLVEGANLVKKHMRRTQQDQQGGVIQKEVTLHVSNVAIVCKRCNKPVRIGFTYLKDGAKARICKKCQEAL